MASFDLFSPFSRPECVQRLQERVGSRLSVHRGVTGRIEETSFWLEKRIPYRNSFKTRLRGQLIEEPEGTRIFCRTGMAPLVVGVLAFWLAIWLPVWTGALLFALFTTPKDAYLPFLMLCIAAAIIGFGRFLARDEAAFLIEFLCNSLNARQLEGAGLSQKA